MRINWFQIKKQELLYAIAIIFLSDHDYDFACLINYFSIGYLCKDCDSNYWQCLCNTNCKNCLYNIKPFCVCKNINFRNFIMKIIEFNLNKNLISVLIKEINIREEQFSDTGNNYLKYLKELEKLL